jgi:hypothetical protein
VIPCTLRPHVAHETRMTERLGHALASDR